MNRKLLFFFTFFFCYIIQAQEDAWVYFNDKPDAAFYLSNPLQMLSQRALDRRANQGISLNNSDVPISQTYIDGITNTVGITVMAKSKWLNALHIRGSQTDIQSLTNLSFVDRIEFADRDLNSRTASTNKVGEIQNINKQLEVLVDYNYGGSINQIQMLNGHLLHQQGYTGKGVDVAIFDSGFIGVNTTSPFANLRNNGQIKSTYNFVSRTNNVYDADRHGARVLSCMGAYNSGNFIGTAPDANYHLFVTEDISKETPLEESLWVEAAEKADSLGVDVINTSLGYTTFDNPAYNYTYTDMNGQTSFIARGLEQAFVKGIFCVVAAGNEGDDAWKYISTPADAKNALTVGSVNASQVYSAFSSIGPSADGRVKPDVMAQGQQVYIVNESGVAIASNGTSFASPVMCGLVACLQQALPDTSPAQLMQVIKQSAHLNANPNFYYGYGIPDFSKALNETLSIHSSESDYSKIHLYPNPFIHQIFIENPAQQDFSVKVHSAQGQLIFHQRVSNEKFVIDSTDWQQGLYVISIENENTKTVNKFVKN